jgi:hypothetical protein
MRSLVLGLDVSPRHMGWALCDIQSGPALATGLQGIELPAREWHPDHLRLAINALCGVEHVLRGEVGLIYIEEPMSVALRPL